MDWVKMWESGNTPWHNDKVVRLAVMLVIIALT